MTLPLTANRELFRQETETNHPKLLSYLKEQLSKQRTMRYAVDRDPATGVLRGAVFFERLSTWASFCKKQPKPLSLCLIELESAEALYQKHGAAVVQQIIAVVGSVLTASFGVADLRGRYQNTIFAVAFPGMLATQCAESVEALLTGIQALEFRGEEEEETFSISCCAGMSQALQPNSSLDELCKSAERKLWRASRQGTGQLFL